MRLSRLRDATTWLTIVSWTAVSLPAQGTEADLGRLTTTAMRAMSAGQWAKALVSFDSAFAIRAINYPLYYAAQSACQVGDTTRAAGYFARARPALLTNPENYEFFAADTLARCLRSRPEWVSFDATMRRGFQAAQAREDAWVAMVNDGTLRLDTNGTPGAYRRPPRTGQWTLQSVRVAGDSVVAPYFLYVPSSYDPARETPLLVFLHEAVTGRRDFTIRAEIARWDSVFTQEAERRGWLLVWPLARKSFNWVEHRRSLDAVTQQIALVRRNYHVDARRIYIGGNSDGGRGALFFAFDSATVAAATFHLATYPSLSTLGAEAPAPPSRTVPMFVLSGGDDSLFPESSVAPLWDALRSKGADVRRRVVPGAGHDVARLDDNFRRVLDEVAQVRRP